MSNPARMETVTVARLAMATRFEIVLHGAEPASLRAAAEEALDEIDRLERQLSLFNPSSEISYLNAYAAERPIQTESGLFGLLLRARDYSELTDGAFDITVGPLLEAWGFRSGPGEEPAAGALATARSLVGMELVDLDTVNSTVYFRKKGVRIDLGAVGKGYALEKAVGILRDAGVENALVHGGTSTISAFGRAPGGDPWRIAIEQPPDPGSAAQPAGSAASALAPLGVVRLENESLSVSAVWGRFFQKEGIFYGHVMHPRQGRPVTENLLGAVILPSPTETDALSTGLLAGGSLLQEKLLLERPEIRSLLIQRATDVPWRVLAKGFPVSGLDPPPGSTGVATDPGVGQS